MRAHLLKMGMNLWPPFRGAGIKVVAIAEDFRSAEVELRMGRLNRNTIGTHFGGSLYAMTDPFYPIMLAHLMGREFRVAHAGARIDFLTPARGTVKANFQVSDEQVDAARRLARDGKKHLLEFPVDIVNRKGEVVARAVQIIYVRLKPPGTAAAQ